MSSTFVQMGLLVLAGFALGLMVGWLAWTSPDPDQHSTGRLPVRLRPMTRGLPDWQVRHDPTERVQPFARPAARRPHSAPGSDEDDEPTFVIGPQHGDAVDGVS